VRSALEEARSAHVAIVANDALDCDVPEVGGRPLFDASTGFGPDFAGYGGWVRAWAADKAAYLIAETNGQARVVNIHQSDALVLDYVNDGFAGALGHCGGCSIVGEVEISSADVLSGQLTEKVVSALQRAPDANALHVPYDALMLLGVESAVQQAGRDDLVVVAGEGFHANLDLIRAGRTQTAAIAYEPEWGGWGAIDALVRTLAGEPDVPDSGLGWRLVDRDANLPVSGGYRSPIDFRAAFRAAWGV
jgi:ribose transport system substrate-binding protein